MKPRNALRVSHVALYFAAFDGRMAIARLRNSWNGGGKAARITRYSIIEALRREAARDGSAVAD